ncbi:MAG: hypothetical protein JSW07_15515 [bacterium]|nr:MAG: hypothetical protein JSW07_15515 [bacterium]
MKIRCNGPNKHINEVDLDEVLKPQMVVRGHPPSATQTPPERLVLECKHCTKGQVVLTREMIEDFQRNSSN